jgi:hypothetical protein
MKTEVAIANFSLACAEMPGYSKDEITPAARLRIKPATKIALYQLLYFSGF